MEADKPKGPAQPEQIEQAEKDPNPGKAQGKNHENEAGKDQPGADGFASARADEDTFD